MRAVIIGATGAVGKVLVRQLLCDDRYNFVEIFVRRSWDIQHPKLICHVVDFEKMDEWHHLIDGDIAFSCLGTTKKLAGSKKNQWRVDYDYVVQFAKYCKAKSVHTFVLVSSMGANYRSKVFYLYLKGRIEQAIAQLHFNRIIIIRPSSLIRPHSDRKGEEWGVKILTWLNRIGLFKAYKPVPVSRVAARIREAAAQHVAYNLVVIDNEEI
ncbi:MULTISPECIES: NAD(P)H-binding protein [unclassified Myroides]|uniref:NAD(P)H-binding protein n=1 Tax=unclassified Myroides TaxID=2642485 RepID=UPI0015FA8E4E|nr:MULTISPECIES: NAD(P)H-binding protein [unclassified Myroides]MBB1151029.1 NAD(P)H-binding protein [Myroides sp. NP-2]MDM1407905.1 NAD(P)H-binding protein [Myroides sp. DF42-4-2]